LTGVLKDAGFTVNKPAGGLYLFPACPDADDVAFAKKCASQNVLLVPGSAFSFSGFFRLCFAVPEKTILGSAKAFAAIGRDYGLC
jgi:aspartate aminotransferase